MGQTATRAVSCDTCGKQYRYKPELAGKKVKCPCGGRVRFPAEEAEETPRVDVALDQLAQAEAAAPQDEQDDMPAEAPPMISAKPARAPAASAKSKLVSTVAKQIGGTSGSEEKWKWWYFVGGGVFMLGYAVWQWIDISFAEATHDNPYDHLRGSSKTLYMLLKNFGLGKIGVVGSTVIVALAAIGFGIWQFKHQQHSQESSES